MTGAPIARQRRHTLHFLGEIRAAAPVFLDTDVDMSAIQAHRAAVRTDGGRLSVVSYVLWAGARVLAAHPAANAAIRGRLRPRVARYAAVSGKLALDKRIGGERVVLSAVLPDLERAGLGDIQALVDHYAGGDPETMPEFGPARSLHRLPGWLGGLAFRTGVRPLGRRAAAFGTFAVSSLGHRPVDGFYSVGGTTITLGLGRIADRPVVRDDRLAIAPVMRLSLTFDHRVIDGAEAADTLAEIKESLEAFAAEAAVSEPAARIGVRAGA
ncbi:2-oxo acid dehydrogenase subunit E2 [Dactylosporangium sp. NPDC051541]|uniref:2-oxo acid dehydrogenase subunit E2 n=1 Tax=Dactylosporangium sp. NPDC051541 TaxID=3363977 RepID=UPI003787919C